jgi:hypothetical protein
MDVDVPDEPNRGCDYSPSSWTRLENGQITSNWKVLYTKTGTDCEASETSTETPPEYSPDTDGDGMPDETDDDDDNDGEPDGSDPDPRSETPPDDGGDGGGGGGGGDTGGGTGTGDGGDGTGTGDTGDGTGDTGTDDGTGTGGGGEGGSIELDHYSGSGYYTPSYPDGLQGVYVNRVEELSNSPLVQSIDETFSVDFAGSCPSWQLDIPYVGASYEADFHCDPQFDWLWSLIAGVVLALASYTAIRIALDY